MQTLSPPASTTRDSYFDNIKAILIFLVVLGHFIEPLIKYETNTVTRSIYIFIYLFHMPCFIFVSGYFSKKGITFFDAFTKFLAPLIVFQLLYTALDITLNLSPFKLQKFLLVPYHALWYLASLCCWNLILNLIPGRRLKLAIILSVILALLIGWFSKVGLPLSLSRTFYFLPFFLLGYHCRQSGLSSMLKATNRQKLFFALLMLAVFAALLAYPYILPEKMLYGNTAYSGMRMGKTKGLLLRAGVLICSLLVGLLFFKLVPSTPTFYSKYGVRTLQIYLLHDFIARLMLHYRPWQFINSQMMLLALALLTTIVIYMITSLPLFGRSLGMISTGAKTLLLSIKRPETSRPGQQQPYI